MGLKIVPGFVDLPPGEKEFDGKRGKDWLYKVTKAINSILLTLNRTDAGIATFAAATTVAVTLSNAQADTNYRVALGPQGNKTFWVSGKTTSGFTINASASSSDVVEWVVSR